MHAGRSACSLITQSFCVKLEVQEWSHVRVQLSLIKRDKRVAGKLPAPHAHRNRYRVLDVFMTNQLHVAIFIVVNLHRDVEGMTNSVIPIQNQSFIVLSKVHTDPKNRRKTQM